MDRALWARFGEALDYGLIDEITATR